jgi:uncharacterized protein YyaL (SSP411 family)
MRWQPWSAETFRASAATGRPILLFLRTAWSHGCARMEREAFADARVRERIEEGFIPVRVDADDRPDIAERYGLEGWPTTLLLTAEGDVLQGGTYLEPAILAELLKGTLRACREAPGEIARRASEMKARRQRAGAPRSATPSLSLADRIAASIAFPNEARFLHGDAIVFLLRYGSPASLSSVRTWLAAADTSALCRDDGAVLRCAARPDWSLPVEEITSDVHASALRGFGEAVRCGEARYTDRLRLIAGVVGRTWLEGAAELPTDAGAELAAASLAAAAVLGDGDLGVAALGWLERVALATYHPGSGVRHTAAASAPGFASDHIALILALLDAHELSGQLPYSMLAEELGHHLIGVFFDERAGAIRDRVHGPDDVARLTEHAYPFRWNARAAGALRRLAAASGDPRFAEGSARLFGWCAARWEEHGLDAATLGLYWPNS